MELINQHTKAIMEECKIRARDAGLTFGDETLEYIVTNRDLIELNPKVMMPTLYDYWVFDVEVIKGKQIYELYPNNPYETVINTRPSISFYNDNNPDWLNVMIFYHVLGHIDFFQNNIYFKHTWDYDFNAKALSDKRMISKLRKEKGRWVDYVIEFTRAIDNLVGYYKSLREYEPNGKSKINKKENFYFDIFLQNEKNFSTTEYLKEIDRYNNIFGKYKEKAIEIFFAEVNNKFPEFESRFNKFSSKKVKEEVDIIQFIMNNSSFLNKEKNKWMKSIIEIVRDTSIFFQPQIRTKIMNEGWASYWHEKLFLQDNRIKGHEVDFARVNAFVTSLPRVGLNPYALGLRLFKNIEDNKNKGKISFEYRNIKEKHKRDKFNKDINNGLDYIFDLRENLNDFLFINNYVDQEFVDKNNLFVAGKRLNEKKMVWEYYIKSRKAEDYKKMLVDSLYHPPIIKVDKIKTDNGNLYITHKFEGKPLVPEYIANVMIGIEFLWGGNIYLDTNEAVRSKEDKQVRYQEVMYSIKDKKLSKKVINGL